MSGKRMVYEQPRDKLPTREVSGGRYPSPRHWLSKLSETSDLKVVTALILIPLVIFVIPALLGVPLAFGDNLSQDYPLRVLVGRDLASLHLPLWDPYIWSGVPLLAGFNAGAAYPATLLFAFLPRNFAWGLDQASVYMVGGLGLYAFLRSNTLSPLASGLGSAVFSYGGFMAAQTPHLGLVMATGWIPWILFALKKSTDSFALKKSTDQARTTSPVALASNHGSKWFPHGFVSPLGHIRLLLAARRMTSRFTSSVRRMPLEWVAILGLSIGLLGLSGSPEPLLGGAVAVGIYALWLLWKGNSHRIELLVSWLVGLFLGAVVALAQWLPGAVFQASSQRGKASYTYFVSGSLEKALTVLLVDPFILGTGHTYPRLFFGAWVANLPEVASYMGILPLVGVLALLAGKYRWYRREHGLLVWYVIGIVGLLLAWGHFTPLGHLFFLVPFYNAQRLINRNLMEVDLAIAVLFAFWLNTLFPLVAVSQTASRDGPEGSITGIEEEAHRNPSLSPSLLSLEGSITGIEEEAHGREDIGKQRWWNRLPGGFELALMAVPTLIVLGLSGAFFFDGPALVRELSSPYKFTVSFLRPMLPLVGIYGLISLLGFAVAIYAYVDAKRRPRLTRWLLVMFVFLDLAVFNLNIQDGPLPQVSSVQKNSSLEASLAKLVPSGTRFAIYDPSQSNEVSLDEVGKPDRNVLYRLASVQGYGALVSSRYDRATGTHTQLNLSLHALREGTFNELSLSVLLVPSSVFSRVEPSLGQIADLPSSYSHATPSLASNKEPSRFSKPLTASHWRYLEKIGPFLAFRNMTVDPPCFIRSLSGATVEGAKARLESVTPWGTTVIKEYSPTPALLVRSEAFYPGWHATLLHKGKAVVAPVVRRFGIVQAVYVPPGSHEVVLSYGPVSDLLAIAISLFGLLALLVLLAVGLLTGRGDR